MGMHWNRLGERRGWSSPPVAVCGISSRPTTADGRPRLAAVPLAVGVPRQQHPPEGAVAQEVVHLEAPAMGRLRASF